jgi:hypothetical protein
MNGCRQKGAFSSSVPMRRKHLSVASALSSELGRRGFQKIRHTDLNRSTGHKVCAGFLILNGAVVWEFVNMEKSSSKQEIWRRLSEIGPNLMWVSKNGIELFERLYGQCISYLPQNQFASFKRNSIHDYGCIDLLAICLTAKGMPRKPEGPLR